MAEERISTGGKSPVPASELKHDYHEKQSTLVEGQDPERFGYTQVSDSTLRVDAPTELTCDSSSN